MKTILFLILSLLLSLSSSAQKLNSSAISLSSIYNAPVSIENNSNIQLKVSFDSEDNLLTILTKDVLVNASVTILTVKDEVIYKEDHIKINNHYLLGIDQNSPQGTYYIYIEEEGRGVWIERFVK